MQEISMYRVVENTAASGKGWNGRKPLVMRLKKIPSVIVHTPAASIQRVVRTDPATSVPASKTAPLCSGRRGSVDMKRDIVKGPAGLTEASTLDSNEEINQKNPRTAPSDPTMLMMREKQQAKLAQIMKKFNAEKKPSKAAKKCSPKLPFRKMVARNYINRFVAI